MGEPVKNEYLDQVMEKQQKLEVDLRAKRALPNQVANVTWVTPGIRANRSR